MTYWDQLHDSGVSFAGIHVDWEGMEIVYNYLDDGLYEIFINTSLVRPGVYPVSVNFIKDNYGLVNTSVIKGSWSNCLKLQSVLLAMID